MPVLLLLNSHNYPADILQEGVGSPPVVPLSDEDKKFSVFACHRQRERESVCVKSEGRD